VLFRAFSLVIVIIPPTNAQLFFIIIIFFIIIKNNCAFVGGIITILWTILLVYNMLNVWNALTRVTLLIGNTIPSFRL
jgi:hypothetical protein